MTRAWFAGACMLVLLAASAVSAGAQTPGSSGGIEVAVGGLWMGRTPLTSGDANETTSSGDPFTLFTTSTALAAMTAGEVQVGFHLRRNLVVFAAGSYGKRPLRISVTNDKENAASVTATERLEQFTVTGGAMWLLSRSRYVPFLRAEAGSLRQLHEGKSLVESGRVFMFGGGVNVPIRTRGASVIGVRLDGRAVVRSKNFLLNSDTITPAAGVSLFMQF